MNADEAMACLISCDKALTARQGDVDKYTSYYDGKHPLMFATEQFREMLGGLFGTFADNWCSLVVDAVAERLHVQGFRFGGSPAADQPAWDIWQYNSLDADSGLAFTDGLVVGRSFGLVWPGDGGALPDVTFEHASQAIVAYIPGSRRLRKCALKRFVGDDGYVWANLYGPDELWKFKSKKKAIGLTGDTSRVLDVGTATLGATTWEPRETPGETWPLINTMGMVPMVELPNRPRLVGEPMSEIQQVVPLQDAVNKLWADLITASEFAAFPQRAVLGTEVPKRAVANPDGTVTWVNMDVQQFSTKRLFWLEDPAAKLDQWAAADLQNYTKTIETAVQHIAALSHTPPHYLMGAIVNASGDALRAAEAGLVSKVSARQLSYGEGLEEMMRLALVAAGNAAMKDEHNSETIWRNSEVRTEAETVDALVKMSTLGVPLEVTWEKWGASPQEIKRWKAMQRSDALMKAATNVAEVINGSAPQRRSIEAEHGAVSPGLIPAGSGVGAPPVAPVAPAAGGRAGT